MNKEEIEAGNIIIAEFDNRLFTELGTGDIYHCKYHSDWNWLMEVVEKIEKIGETDKKYGTLCDITTNYINVGHIVLDHKLQDYSTKIEGVFKAVVKYIKWRNEQGV